MEHPFVFEVDSDIVNSVRRDNPNFLIRYSGKVENREYCAVYFCSNDIFYPNNEQIFRKRIIEKDFYEWYSTRVAKACKHIFVRDLFKQWYLAGISSTVNSPELLLDFLKKETDGYKVITVGSSAGGYAAILYGLQLKAETAIAFNPQIELESALIDSSEDVDPLIFRLKDTPVRKYYDLLNWMNPETRIFYFCSNRSVKDAAQRSHLEKAETRSSVHVVGFGTSHHGIPFPKVCLSKVINMDNGTLASLSRRTHNPWIFSVKIAGLRNTLTGTAKQAYDYYKKRR